MTTMAEPEWDQETRDLAQAHAQIDLCPVCRGPAYLCQDPELQDRWVGTDPVRCHRTTAIRQRQKGVTETTNPIMDALAWGATLRGGHGAR